MIVLKSYTFTELVARRLGECSELHIVLRHTSSRILHQSCFTIRTRIYKSQGEFELDLAHEIYPGHHWERTHTRQLFRNKIGCLTYESWPFLEGWAKYCEFFYAEVTNDTEITRAARVQRALIALKALAALWIHTSERTFPEILRELQELTGLPSNKVRSVLLEAYFNPLLSIAPLIGYLAFQRLVKNQDNMKQVHNWILATGPTVLWKVDI